MTVEDKTTGNKPVGIYVKVPPELKAELAELRALAKAQGKRVNVNAEVVRSLKKLARKLRRSLESGGRPTADAHPSPAPEASTDEPKTDPDGQLWFSL